MYELGLATAIDKFPYTFSNRRCTNENKFDFCMTPHAEVQFQHGQIFF